MALSKYIARLLRITGIMGIAVAILMIAYAFLIGKPADLCYYMMCVSLYAGLYGIMIYSISKIMDSDDTLTKIQFTGLIIIAAGILTESFIPQMDKIAGLRLNEWYSIITFIGGFMLWGICYGLKECKKEREKKSVFEKEGNK